jgi:hypothetical protein
MLLYSGQEGPIQAARTKWSVSCGRRTVCHSRQLALATRAAPLGGMTDLVSSQRVDQDATSSRKKPVVVRLAVEVNTFARHVP